MSAKKATTKSATKTPASKTKFKGLSAEEIAAMKNRAKELKAEARENQTKAQGESDVREAIAGMKEPDRVLAKRLDAIIKASAPSLAAKTWYGMPAYAKDGKIICFFQPALKFNTRYATFGFNDSANLDDGEMWSVAFAVQKLNADVEARIGALVKKAAS